MFSFWEKKKPAPLRKPAPRDDERPAPNKRTAFRAEVDFAVYYELVGRPGERRATGNDLSSGGLRLLIDEDMIREQEVLLHFTLPSDFLDNFKEYKEVEEATPFGPRKKKVPKPPRKFAEMHVRAKSLIVFFNFPRARFVHGMQFVDASEEMMDEIHRFAHYWQLEQLRLKAEREEKLKY